MPDATNPEIDIEILNAWQLSPVHDLGGRHNRHWLVKTPSGNERVLRQYQENHFPELDYEFEVMSRLHDLRWPVPELVEQPINHAGRTWCLFTKLPGTSSPLKGKEEQRQRGRLLAELHESTIELTDLGQRQGFLLPDAMLNDPLLLKAIKKVEAVLPETGYILRWHIERAAEQLDTLNLEEADPLVLHSDFTAWNILFDNGEATGILDFEATHLNVRVADFALSWRGHYDEVIHGYEEVHKLSDLDWQLLVPAFWSWIFIGVQNWIEQIGPDKLQPENFGWQIHHLTRRSPLFGNLTEPFPGRVQ